MQQIPKNMPKAPSFDNVQDMLKWYRRNYRIPTFKNKVKRITKNVKGATTKGAGEYGRIFHPRELIDNGKIAVDEFRKMMGLKTNKIPDSIMKEGIKGTKLRNYLLDQLDKSFDEALKTPAVRKSPQVLIPALSKAAGIFSMLVPSPLDQENTMELPLPNNPFPAENAQIRQLQQQQPQEGSNPRAMYSHGGIVQPTAPKIKRKTKKTNKLELLVQHNGILAEKRKELTDKQKSFLSSLFESGGNINVALDKAGYAKTSRSMVLKTLSDEILEAAKTEMAAHSVTAIHRVVEGMNDVGEHPRAELRLKAAQTLLDRVGLGKQEKVEIEGKLLHGVVLMPSKKAMPTVTINEE